MKTCLQCAETKPLESFARNGGNSLHARCKMCMAENAREKRKENPEHYRSLDNARHQRDREFRLQRMKAYGELHKQHKLDKEKARYQANPDAIKAKVKAYRQENKEKVREWNGSRRAILRKAMPAWADKKVIAEIYRKASELWKQTGIPHHVDHIIPLKGDGVSGLHVEYNLQILTAQENLSKGRKWAA
jgi:5-methylcytosine-specific restriction endonuclease McrA